MLFSRVLILALLTLFALRFGGGFAIAQERKAGADCEKSKEAQIFEKTLEREKTELVQINGDGTDQKLKAELLAMGKRDQDIRKRMFSLPRDQQAALIPELQKTDKSLTNRLKQIVDTYGWPTIALVGIQASQAAVLILVHTMLVEEDLK